LPRATVFAGVVQDEAGRPVAGAKIEFEMPGGIDPSQQENIEFGPDTSVTTDANGHWFSSMIPTDDDQINLRLTEAHHAEMTAELHPNGPDATNSFIVMPNGFDVAGAVTDANGLAIANAKVREVRLNSEGEAKTTTDALGNFLFKNRKAGELTLAVQAEGFAPTVKTIEVGGKIAPLQFQLAPGSLLRGHVVDENGNPIAQATVETEGDSMGIRKVEWSDTTGKTGRFEWNSAAPDPLVYRITAGGFNSAYNITLAADGSDHEIKLSHLTPGKDVVQIAGTAVDAESGQPLDGFKVQMRRVEPDWVVPFDFVTSGQSGKFAVSVPVVSLHTNYQIELEKDGYLPAISGNLLTRDGNQTLAFKMERGSGPSGVVLLPGGEPAVNATVYLCTEQAGVRLNVPGRVQKGINTTTYLARTDEAGKFSLAAAPASQGLVIIHDNGFAQVSAAALAAGGAITLQAWGRIEGSMTLDSQPVANETIFANDFSQQFDAQGRRYGGFGYEYQTKTDAAGKFVFDKVPPGPCRIARNNLDHVARVTINAGETTRVTLGGSGVAVVGTVTLPGSLDAIDWPAAWVRLLTKTSQPVDVPPQLRNYASVPAFVEAWRTWQASYNERNEFFGHCRADGSFRLPDVPAGDYALRIVLCDNKHNSVSASPTGGVGPAIASLDREVTVGQDTLDLGALLLSPITQSAAAQ